MKKLFVTLMVVFSMTLFVNAQEVIENGPEIEFEKTLYLYGQQNAIAAEVLDVN